MLKIEDLYFNYKDEKNTLSNLNLTINDGEWVSIVGHNGSGKSTLSKLLLGLLLPKSGNIYVNDLKLDESNISKIRKEIGLVFQNPDNQFIRGTVEEDIAFGLENLQIENSKMSKIVREFAKKVNMEKFLKVEPEKLSGGQKQRVAIAGLLALDRKILVFDECTSMIDPAGKAEIIKLIRDLNKEENKTIITITHDLNFATLSDRVVVLNKGEIVLEGSPKEVLNEKDVLTKSNLKVPFKIELFNSIKDSNTQLGDEIWKLISET